MLLELVTITVIFLKKECICLSVSMFSKGFGAPHEPELPSLVAFSGEEV